MVKTNHFRSLALLALLCALAFPAMAQKVAIKHNLLQDILPSPNIALEVGVAPQWTVDAQVNANFFLYGKDATASNYSTKKVSHWMVQPEVRYWTCEAFNGLFFGLHGLAGQANVAGYNIPFVSLNPKPTTMAENRYEGAFYGAGISVGYQWLLSKYFSVEAGVGVGYITGNYNQFKCIACGEKTGTGKANYIGPTKAAISLVYMIR